MGFALALTVVTAVYSFYAVDRDSMLPVSKEVKPPLSEKIKFKKLLEEGELSLGDLKGKVVLINFWASWCGPCISEMPSLAALQGKFSKDEFVVLAVNLDEDVAEAKSILKKLFGNDLPFLVVKGEGSEIVNQFPLQGLPYTAILDGAGIVRSSSAGSRDWDSGRWLTFVRALSRANKK